MRRLALIAALTAVLAPASATAATQRTTMAKVLPYFMCVTCDIPLANAQSPQAEKERAYIQQLINARVRRRRPGAGERRRRTPRGRAGALRQLSPAPRGPRRRLRYICSGALTPSNSSAIAIACLAARQSAIRSVSVVGGSAPTT